MLQFGLELPSFLKELEDFPLGSETTNAQIIQFPGLIDLHIHGAFGWDFSFGNPDQLNKLLDRLAQTGLVGILPTIITCPEDQLIQALRDLRKIKETRRAPPEILGIYLEGPFLSPTRRGSHRLELLTLPNIEKVHKWQDEAGGIIRMITVAPELEGAIDFIEKISEMNIIPTIGHTDADHETTLKAISAGAQHVTHLFNAMKPFTHRESSVVSAILSSPEPTVELIGDSIHIAPEILKMVFHLLGAFRIALVSDAVCIAGLPDGVYSVYETQLELKSGKCTFVNGHLFGGGKSLLSQIPELLATTSLSRDTIMTSVYLTPLRILRAKVPPSTVIFDSNWKWLATKFNNLWYWGDKPSNEN